MTKKTNGLLLRFGINSFWQNKNINTKTFLKIFQLENLITLELKKKNINIFKWKYSDNTITIFIYYSSFFSNTINDEIITKYKVKPNLKKIIQKFGISKKQLILTYKTLSLTKLNLPKDIKIQFYIHKLKQLKLKRLLMIIVLSTLRQNNFARYVNIEKTIYTYLQNKSKSTVNTIYKLNINQVQPRSNLQKKFDGFIKYKTLAVYLENKILKTLNMFYKINFINILLKTPKDICIKKPRFDNLHAFYITLLATTYTNSSFLANFLALKLRSSKNHRKILSKFIWVLEDSFYSNYIKLVGVQIRVSGKLGGKMRKSKYHYKLGKVQLQTIQQNLNYSYVPSYTKFGVLSVKIWLLNANNNL